MKSGEKKFWGTAVIPGNVTEKAEIGRENYKHGILCIKAK